MGQVQDLNEYFYQMERIKLDSGRIIYMAWLQQGCTYGNQLEGLPVFEGIAITEPRLIEGGNERYLLVDQSPIPLPISEEQKQRYLQNPRVRRNKYPLTSLAPVSCRAEFRSKPTSNAGEDAWASRLVMEWYQQRFAMPIEERILAKIKALDWDALAEDQGAF